MFYFKLASQNMKKSFTVFAPFILASLFLFTVLCSLFQLIFSPVMETMGSGAISLGLGVIVLTIFSLIMEIYSFNFLMKQRTREFGLYNMLGMNKKKVSLIASIELLFIFILILLLGSAFSSVFSNVLYLIFVNLTQYHELNFSVSPLAFVSTAFIFLGIFIVLECISIVTIRRTSPLILFKASHKGEKEPRGNSLLAILSCLSLGIGYYLSLSSKASGAGIIGRFFLAVLLVIIGTYLFYISFITWYLKKRQQNQDYFYKPEHFITTSQMIFRMKQHATGLANITLLSVMAFVTIATTTSLYSSFATSIESLYPKESSVSLYAEDRQRGEVYLQEAVLSHFPDKAADKITYLLFRGGMSYDGGDSITITPEALQNQNMSTMYYAYFITQEDFQALGHHLTLSNNQMAFILPDTTKHTVKQFVIGDTTFENVNYSGSLHFPDITNTYNPALIVVHDEQILSKIRDIYATNQSSGMLQGMEYRAFLDLTEAEVETLGENNGDTISLIDATGEPIGLIFQKTTFKNMILGFTGGFLFAGFILGISFLLGAALIIYYKQYSEGHEDKKSYKVLQEIGMSEKAVKKTINSQVLMVFFMPLIMATVHFMIALVMLKQMLLMFGVTSSHLIYIVSGSTILGICIMYYLIYKWTSRTYYRIIER
ncbi:FtsX-like permease family protein [Streptococcus suis]|nr:FtsX-like permease family protein [Streptococcus suis]